MNNKSLDSRHTGYFKSLTIEEVCFYHQAKVNVEILHYFPSFFHGKRNFSKRDLTSETTHLIPGLKSGVRAGLKPPSGSVWTPLTCSSGSPVAEEAMLETARLLRLSGNFNPGI